MTRKRRPITIRPLRIPASKRLGEAARRIAKGFLNDLREAAGKPSKTGKGGSTANPWPKCGECFHRVPVLCGFCLRGRARITETHPTSCCPGECIWCHRCLNECPGQCDKCQNCLDRCSCKEGDR